MIGFLTFCLLMNQFFKDNKKAIWYKIDGKPDIEQKNSNYKIMIWGGISRKGKTKLTAYRLDKKETVNSEAYIKTLQEYCIDHSTKCSVKLGD